MLPCVQGEAVWHVSAAATGMRQLVIVTLLRPFLDVTGLLAYSRGE